jgi:predicted ATPase
MLKGYLSKPGLGSQTGRVAKGESTYNPAMLKRLYIDNFRCFVNFEYKPERKQLLLGANGSGKSSLMEVVRKLKEFIRGGENPFTQSTRTRWQDRPFQVFEIEALLDDQVYEYRLEIRYSSESKLPSIAVETLTVAGAPVFELSKGEIRFFPEEGARSSVLRWETTESALHLAQFSNSSVRRFVEWLDSVCCFSIDVYPGQMDEVADTESRQPDYELDNLAGWYLHLIQENPEGNANLLASLKAALNGFISLRFKTEEGGLRKLLVDSESPAKGRVAYTISELSDGQRKLMALYMILHFLLVKGLAVFIDEPDNFLSLREIQPWLLSAEEAVDDCKGQLILISHHPEILNQWSQEYGLRFFREENGHVRTEKFKTDYDGVLQPSEVIARGWENE